MSLAFPALAAEGGRADSQGIAERSTPSSCNSKALGEMNRQEENMAGEHLGNERGQGPA